MNELLLGSVSSFLGTTWWSVLCVVAGFMGGVYFADTIKRMLGR